MSSLPSLSLTRSRTAIRGHIQVLPSSPLAFFLRAFLASSPFYNYSATMTSLNVAPHSYDPVRDATPVREREGRKRDGGCCTVQPGWRTFDPDILHAGCAARPAGRLIEIEGEHPPRADPLQPVRFLARLQMPDIHLIFSADDVDEIRSTSDERRATSDELEPPPLKCAAARPM